MCQMLRLCVLNEQSAFDFHNSINSDEECEDEPINPTVIFSQQNQHPMSV